MICEEEMIEQRPSVEVDITVHVDDMQMENQQSYIDTNSQEDVLLEDKLIGIE